mgnify:CR=1 FL=1
MSTASEPELVKKSFVMPAGRELDSFLRELECLGMRHLKRRREIHLCRLILDRFDDLRTRMPCVDAPQARHGIEDLPTIVRPVVHAAGACQ